MKILNTTLLISSFLFLASCQGERKTCKFQGVEVSCAALGDQLLLQQQQAEAQAQAQQKPVAEKLIIEEKAEVEEKTSAEIIIQVTITSNKIEFLENKEDSYQVSNGEREMACKVASRAGEVVLFKLDKDMLLLKTGGQTYTYTRKSKGTGLLGTWFRKTYYTGGTANTLLEIQDMNTIKRTKTCSLKK